MFCVLFSRFKTAIVIFTLNVLLCTERYNAFRLKLNLGLHMGAYIINKKKKKTL
jgi:hypothetical protein